MTSLRILVYPHDMEIGGSQLNAIELGKAVKDLGHEVIVIGEDGSLVRVVEQLGMEMLLLNADRRRPSLATIYRLRNLVASRNLDIVHGYEWPPGLEAAAAVFLANRRTAAVCTVMSMAVAPFLPNRLPLVVGTRALLERSAPHRLGSVHLMEPPVDVEKNAPGHPVGDFYQRFGLVDDPPGAPPGRMVNVAVICRLVPELKLEGVLSAIDVIAKLARERPVRLIIVGDGDARCIVEQRAAQANAYTGWRSVILTGALLDPRPAYAAADVMLGMGGSALRALAFGKPLVVQGEQGFWELLTPESCSLFLSQGWYGIGSDSTGEERLKSALKVLLDNPDLREGLGRYGRDLVAHKFSLQQAARKLEDIYRKAFATRSQSSMTREGVALVRSATGVLRHKVKRRYEGLRGARTRDDFNSLGLVTLANAPRPTEGRSRTGNEPSRWTS